MTGPPPERILHSCMEKPTKHLRNDAAIAFASTRVPTISIDATIGSIDDLLIRRAKDFETIHYVFVLSKTGELRGTISVREVFAQENTTPVASVMHDHPISVSPATNAEHAALLALQAGIKAMPVVDAKGKFLGAITGDNIMRLLHEELTEDLLRLSGLHGTEQLSRRMDNISTLGITTSLRHRLPWLLIGLLGGIAAAKVIDAFEGVLSTNLILAAYIPLIVYMADAVGTQMEAFIIRDLALNPALRFHRYLAHQFIVVLCIALILSALFVGIGFVFHGSLRVAMAIGLSLGAAILSSMFSGLIIPYLFSKIRLDPANASGPIATIIQDLLSVTVYFTIAAALLQ